MLRPFVSLILFVLVPQLSAIDMSVPTDNASIFLAEGASQFFQGTAGHDYTSGGYGCTRSGGRQFHEGIDIRCLHRDRRGEPTDPVLAIADGEVAYVSAIAGQSNYGRYIVLRHLWNEVEAFSLYAHLGGIASGLRAGQTIKRGQQIAILGHSGTQNIPRDRAHLHLEITFQLNRNFAAYFAPRQARGERNDHANFNGINLQGIDPTPILIAAHEDPNFNFRQYVESLPIAFTTVFPARHAPLSWMRAQPWCVVNGPEQRPITSYEVSFTAVGVPTLARPQTDTTVRGCTLSSVVQESIFLCPCRHLVERDSRRIGWHLGQKGLELMELLCF